jgi:hypothetical protein
MATRGGGGGGGMLGSLFMAPLKFWLYGTALLAAVSIGLAVAFSNLMVHVFGVTVAIVSTDANEFDDAFAEGQRAANAGGQLSPAGGAQASEPEEDEAPAGDGGN